MVKIINKSVCRGVAGKRSGKVLGVVIHNTWDNNSAESHLTRLGNMTSNQLAAGFAHYYIDHKTIVRTEDTFNRAWHVANEYGNNGYLGYEVRGNRDTPRDEYLKGEQNALKQAAEDLNYYNLPANRTTVALHHEFSDTECPKRALIEHCGYDSTQVVPEAISNKLKDYYIAEIKKYMNGTVTSSKPKETTYHDKAGWYKMKVDDTFYIDKHLSKVSGWKLAKGSVFHIDKVVKVGKMARGEVQLGTVKRYMTLNTDIVDKA
ncbi:N-acetylmuramoyl-L-alanine amidase [Vagococcus intermedius]|uniref:N-acetylmuramoyl-L-alanine amidase n=1 Tax=Vagococcus intermedius TaxID=2991418 RepID=UPI0023B7ED9E|nr:N-acetylmuramoyl-L-alanine amidase [Vagococcus intermedius]WEG76491.1 N-acetylmuramoyl-L-alanine amidase [Vagococcus intermedius]